LEEGSRRRVFAKQFAYFEDWLCIGELLVILLSRHCLGWAQNIARQFRVRYNLVWRSTE